MRAPADQVKKIIVFSAELLLGPPCDFKKGLNELIAKPKVFIELSLGLEDRLEASHIHVLKEVQAANFNLDAIKKISVAAYGLALWLSTLADFVHATGIVNKAKFLPQQKRQKQNQWQYSSNTE